MLERREFIQALGAATLAGWAHPAEAGPLPVYPDLIHRALCPEAPPLPSDQLFRRSSETYWSELRRQFLFRRGFLYLNNGTVGSSPLPVVRAFLESVLREEQLENDDTEQYPLWGYGRWDAYRRPMAEFIGAELDELALVRNATEGLNYVANGLDLKPGDEVLTTDQEHPSGLEPWRLKAKRYGIEVKQVELPIPPTSKQQLLDFFEAQRTTRTRVLLVSHVTTTTGVVLPVRELCGWARQHGIFSLVDGAHAVGMFPVNVKEIDCDFYVSSPHKWLLAPLGCGLLYVRNDVLDRLWNTLATAEWDNREIRAARLQHFGSTNMSLLVGLKAAIDFWRAIGPKRIERRIRDLHAYLKGRIADFPGAELHSAPGEEFTGGILAVNFPRLDRMKLQQWLYEKHRIRIRGTSETRLRLSTHIYLNQADLDRFLAALEEYLQSQTA
ncbi:aminotransferase class V-fold PLP-dependent enzyme [Acidobacteriia bacterium AH_259_A11_L15]|nr:aminotransferase class V-fold PLP-dependent enzyme [Acidobacteriia bacterium AH_259_A11_L15]